MSDLHKNTDDDGEHDACPHVAGPPFGVNAADHPGTEIIGQTLVCCQCGRAKVRYLGLTELGHGPYVEYTLPIFLPGNGVGFAGPGVA